MDTKNQSATKIPTVRTFAKDLELGRKNKNLSTESNKSVTKQIIEPTKVTDTTKKNEVVIESEERDQVKSTAPEIKKLVNVGAKKTVPVIPRRDTFIVENEDSAAATIITDTKHNRFKLAPAIKSSLTGWFSSKKDSYKASKVPKYTVPDTTRRKGVIQKATSNTGRLATSDFSSIHERIRDRKERESRPAATTTWSANTEPVFLLLENSNNNIANVQMTGRRSFRTSPQEIVVTEINRNKRTEVKSDTPRREFESPIVPFVESAEVVTPAEISGEISAGVPTEVTVMTPTEPTNSIQEIVTEIVNNPNNTAENIQHDTYEIIEPATQQQSITPTPEVTYSEEPVSINQNYEPRWESELPAGYYPPETQEVPTPISPEIIPPTQMTETYTEISSEEVQNPTNTTDQVAEQLIPEETSLIEVVRKRGILSLNTNILTLGVSAFVLLILILIGSGYFWYNSQNENYPTTTTREIAQIINLPLEKMSGGDNSKESFQSALDKVRNEKNESVQVVFLSNNPNYDPIAPSVLLSTFDIFLEQNFERSISALRFGFTEDKQPFVIIKTTNEKVAKGGMLMWEKGMYEDLAEIFSLAEIDPSINSKFIDSTLDNTDLRVLKNATGSEQLIYGIKNNTVIITTNIFNFSELSRLTFK